MFISKNDSRWKKLSGRTYLIGGLLIHCLSSASVGVFPGRSDARTRGSMKSLPSALAMLSVLDSHKRESISLQSSLFDLKNLLVKPTMSPTHLVP